MQWEDRMEENRKCSSKVPIIFMRRRTGPRWLPERSSLCIADGRPCNSVNSWDQLGKLTMHKTRLSLLRVRCSSATTKPTSHPSSPVWSSPTPSLPHVIFFKTYSTSPYRIRRMDAVTPLTRHRLQSGICSSIFPCCWSLQTTLRDHVTQTRAHANVPTPVAVFSSSFR